MAVLHSDENFDQRVVEELRKLGHDVLTAKDAGRAGQGIPDHDVLAFAISQNRAVITFDRWHFLRLHKQTPAHCGIVICTDDKNIQALANRIHQTILNCPVLNNQLIRVIRPPIP
jgi:predicted nuclease of predicted toxin-antitoxin system